MEQIINLLGSQSNLSGILQIGLDIVVLALLAVLLAGRKHKGSFKDNNVLASFEKIIEETRVISGEFEMNLEKRQELIRDITAKLDQRIHEAQDLCVRLERLAQAGAENLKALSAAATPPSPGNRNSGKADHQKVLLLANKGLDAAQIAKTLKKPLGEVELILSLSKIAS